MLGFLERKIKWWRNGSLYISGSLYIFGDCNNNLVKPVLGSKMLWCKIHNNDPMSRVNINRLNPKDTIIPIIRWQCSEDDERRERIPEGKWWRDGWVITLISWTKWLIRSNIVIIIVFYSNIKYLNLMNVFVWHCKTRVNNEIRYWDKDFRCWFYPVYGCFLFGRSPCRSKTLRSNLCDLLTAG